VPAAIAKPLARDDLIQDVGLGAEMVGQRARCRANGVAQATEAHRAQAAMGKLSPSRLDQAIYLGLRGGSNVWRR